MAKSSLIIITTSPSLRDRLKKDLSSDFNLTWFSSGTEALKAIQKKIPDAVVMDHSLEDFLTNRFIDKVRNNPMTRNLSFIVVSRESSHSFVEQAVRSGVSHYIGMPYESKIFIEKVKMSLQPGQYIPRERYFSLPASEETQVVSFGRISYISDTGIHFETHLKLEPKMQIQFRSPLSDGLAMTGIAIEIKEVGSDVFYNYPFAVDAVWVDPEVGKKVHAWIQGHRQLNSPKKSKILFISSDVEFETRLSDGLDKNQYSPRFDLGVEEGLRSLPFMKPSCVAVHADAWRQVSAVIQQKFLAALKCPWMLFGDDKDLKFPDAQKPMIIPSQVEAISAAVRTLFPPKPLDPDRLYFSKTLEDSRLRIFLKGKVLVLGELGVTLALEQDLVPPCNLELDMKTFTEQDLRNPFIRAWPPARKLSGPQTESGKYKVSLEAHFLGVNDQQGQAIRQWLRAEELKENRKLIEDKLPASIPTPDGKPEEK